MNKQGIQNNWLGTCIHGCVALQLQQQQIRDWAGEVGNWAGDGKQNWEARKNCLMSSIQDDELLRRGEGVGWGDCSWTDERTHGGVVRVVEADTHDIRLGAVGSAQRWRGLEATASMIQNTMRTGVGGQEAEGNYEDDRSIQRCLELKRRVASDCRRWHGVLNSWKEPGVEEEESWVSDRCYLPLVLARGHSGSWCACIEEGGRLVQGRNDGRTASGEEVDLMVVDIDLVCLTCCAVGSMIAVCV